MDQIDEREERSAERDSPEAGSGQGSPDPQLPLPLPPPVSYALQRLSEKRKCHKTLSLPPISSRRLDGDGEGNSSWEKRSTCY